MMSFRKSALLGPVVIMLAACGGGGGSSGGEGIQLVRPSVTVDNLSSGTATVKLSEGGETLSFSSNTTKTFSNQVQAGSGYTLTVTSGACVFSNGSTTISGKNNSAGNFSVSCGVTTGGDPGETDQDDQALRLLGNAETQPFIVTAALQTVDPNTGQPYTGNLLLSQMSVLVNGGPAGEGEAVIHLEAAPEVQKVIRVYVDVSESMVPHLGDIEQALLDLHNHLSGNLNHRMKFHWFDESFVEIVNYSDEWPSAATTFDAKMPPRGSAMKASDILGALRTATTHSGISVSPVHVSMEDVIVITDGLHTMGDEATATESTRELIEGEDIEVVLYGNNAYPGLMEQVTSSVTTISSQANLSSHLISRADGQNDRAGGVRLLQYASPLRSGEHTMEITLNRGDLCINGWSCSRQLAFSAAGFQPRRGTILLTDRESPYEGATVKLKVMSWLDQEPGACSPSGGTYAWSVSDNGVLATPPGADSDYRLLSFPDTTANTVEVVADAGLESCSDELDFNPAEQPEFED